MTIEIRDVPLDNGLYTRDAMPGAVTDLDDSTHELQMKFPCDVRDSYDTTFPTGAFDEGWSKRQPLLCFQHVLADPIGKVINTQSTRTNHEIRAKFSSLDDVPTARRAYSQVKDGTLDNVSFGFRSPRMAPHPTMRGVRAITKANMIEVSVVSMGSIPGAVVTGIREEDLMSEHSALEIAKLVETKLITVEEGQRMLAEIEGYRDHITVITPPDDGGIDVAASEAMAQMQERIEQLDAQLREAGVIVEEPTDDEWVPPEIPSTVRAADFFGALHPSWQRELQGIRIAIAAEGQEFPYERAAGPDENILTIALAVDAACDSATEWVREADISVLPEEVQQAVALWEAAGSSVQTMLDVMGVEDQSAASQRAMMSPSSEPMNPTDSENMAPTQVKCLECGGTGQTEDGKTCPECMGSGIVAVTRADIPDDAPDNAATCPSCMGKGKVAFAKGMKILRVMKHKRDDEAGIREGAMKCPDCGGKGWVTKKAADAMDTRANSSGWSTKPWSDFNQSDYTPEQWKDACLIVDGDGSTKAQCQLPVKEPSGMYNVNGIAAAAGRLDQVKTDGDSVADAAGALADLYGKMKKPAPPNVEKYVSRADLELSEEEAAAEYQRSLELLERRSSKRTTK